MNHILFPITYACNLSCKFCAAKNSKTIDIELSVEALKEKKDQVEWIYITGGEPFLIHDLPSVCDRIKAMGFKVGVTTNGTIFRPEIADHVDRIGISLDGDKEYHDSYRGEGVFDKAVELFYAVKGKCDTVIMSVAFKENQEALKKLESVIQQMDPTYWQIQRDMYDANVTIPVQI
ncbi:MAG: radical SAM protein [Bacteroidetes bacterium]|nr:radical SAM protein [Bacteroidota bacterium]